MIGRRWALVTLVGIALVLVAGRTLASLYADHLWFDAMDAPAIWRTKTLYTALTTWGSAVVAASAIFDSDDVAAAYGLLADAVA